MTEEEFEKLWKDLVNRFFRNKSELTREELLFYAVNILRGSVPRSGFIGYFENNEGPTIMAAKEGLMEMNLQTGLKILEIAQEIIMGDSPLPTDDKPIMLLPHDTEEQYKKACEKLEFALHKVEKDFYEYEEKLWEGLLNYASDNQLKPRD